MNTGSPCTDAQSDLTTPESTGCLLARVRDASYPVAAGCTQSDWRSIDPRSPPALQAWRRLRLGHSQPPPTVPATGGDRLPAADVKCRCADWRHGSAARVLQPRSEVWSGVDAVISSPPPMMGPTSRAGRHLRPAVW